jgi:hypothetical protein
MATSEEALSHSGFRLNIGEMPVTLLVGRLMLDTRGARIGSLPLRKTIGIV